MRAIVIALVAFLIALGPAGADVPVDVELVLAADVSDSMDHSTGTLQRQGYAAALRDPDIWASIASGAIGAVAITYFEWGDAGHINVVVPWTVLRSSADARRMADTLELAPVAKYAKTSISHALNFAMHVIEENGYQGARRVIDVSGNGPNNQGGAVDLVRDELVARGITINGLPILTDLSQPRGTFATGFDLRLLDRYYAACVVGGSGAFVLAVRHPDAFLEALRRKLFAEIAGVPLWHAGGKRLRPIQQGGAAALAGDMECS